MMKYTQCKCMAIFMLMWWLKGSAQLSGRKHWLLLQLTGFLWCIKLITDNVWQTHKTATTSLWFQRCRWRQRRLWRQLVKLCSTIACETFFSFSLKVCSTFTCPTYLLVYKSGSNIKVQWDVVACFFGKRNRSMQGCFQHKTFRQKITFYKVLLPLLLFLWT